MMIKRAGIIIAVLLIFIFVIIINNKFDITGNAVFTDDYTVDISNNININNHNNVQWNGNSKYSAKLVQSSSVPTNGLMINWNFNDGTAKDTSGNNNDGTNNGATSVVGKVGNAMQFDGINDYVSLSNYLPINDKVSTAFWINRDVVDGGLESIYRSGSNCWNSNFNPQINFYANTNVLVSTLCNNNALTNFPQFITPGAGIWKHIAVVYDGTIINIYIDGVLFSAQSKSYFSGNVGSSPGSVFLLGGSPSGSDSYTGKLDEFLLYNIVLTETEVQGIFSGAGQSNFQGGSFTSKIVNLGQNSNRYTVTWIETGTNGIKVEVSINGGNTWFVAENGVEKTTNMNINSLLYRVTFLSQDATIDKITIDSRFVEAPAGVVCGDNVKDSSEGCDNGVNNGVKCIPSDSTGCSYCGEVCKIKTVPYSNTLVMPPSEDIMCDGEDLDGDGYRIGTDVSCPNDCDDSDFNVNQGKIEECDGIDNNCDGNIDEGCDTVSYDPTYGEIESSGSFQEESSDLDKENPNKLDSSLSQSGSEELNTGLLKFIIGVIAVVFIILVIVITIIAIILNSGKNQNGKKINNNKNNMQEKKIARKKSIRKEKSLKEGKKVRK